PREGHRRQPRRGAQARHAGRGGAQAGGGRPMSAASTAAIRFDAVTRRYGAVTAVDKLSFEVQPGEMFGLIGPEGAGKTTSIRLTGGLLRPDTGTIRVFGRDPVAWHRAITGEGGYVLQGVCVARHMTIGASNAFVTEDRGLMR